MHEKIVIFNEAVLKDFMETFDGDFPEIKDKLQRYKSQGNFDDKDIKSKFERYKDRLEKLVSDYKESISYLSKTHQAASSSESSSSSHT